MTGTTDFYGDIWTREAGTGYVQYSFTSEVDVSATVVYASRHDWSIVIVNVGSCEVESFFTSSVNGQWGGPGMSLHDVVQEASDDLQRVAEELAEDSLDHFYSIR